MPNSDLLPISDFLFTHSFNCDIVHWHISDLYLIISTYEWGLKPISKYQNTYVFFPVYTVIEHIRSVSHNEQKFGIGSHLTDSVNEA